MKVWYVLPIKGSSCHAHICIVTKMGIYSFRFGCKRSFNSIQFGNKCDVTPHTSFEYNFKRLTGKRKPFGYKDGEPTWYIWDRHGNGPTKLYIRCPKSEYTWQDQDKGSYLSSRIKIGTVTMNAAPNVFVSSGVNWVLHATVTANYKVSK